MTLITVSAAEPISTITKLSDGNYGYKSNINNFEIKFLNDMKVNEVYANLYTRFYNDNITIDVMIDDFATKGSSYASYITWGNKELKTDKYHKVNYRRNTKVGGYPAYEMSYERIKLSKVENDKQLFVILNEYAAAKNSYDSVKGALFEVEKTDYGIVAPKLSEMTLEKPEVFKQGNKYGVRIKASAPCLHIIKTDITTEVSPLVGTESQSSDLANLLMEQYNKADETLWETNLFGKTLREMVTEQMTSKVQDVPEVLRGKVQKSLQKISDDGKDYFICIII